MSTIRRGNWGFRDPGDEIADDSIIEGGNFSQAAPDTPIMAGKPLTIRDGNFTNVRRDPSWTIEGGNWTQVSRCAHLHPEWLAAGRLAAEPVACPHVVATDEIVGGETVYTYEDTVQ